MSGGYAQAMMGVADAMTGASADAAYEAAYGKFYTAYTHMHNAANQKVAAEANIAAITQNQINTDKVIAMQQDQAEAQAKVAAAVSGTAGGSVDAAIYQTEVNSSLSKANNRANAQNQIEQQLSAVYNSQSTLLAVDNPQVAQISIGMTLAQAGANYMSTSSGKFMDGLDNLFGSSTQGDIINPADSGNPQI